MFKKKKKKDEELGDIVLNAKPCPFCGSKMIKLTVRTVEIFNEYRYWCTCIECKTEGPATMRADEAIGCWNKRTKVNNGR